MTDAQKKPLIGMTLPELKDTVKALGIPAFKGLQIARWIYARRATDIAQMTDLSKKERDVLSAAFTVGRQEPLKQAISSDGTAKYLFPGVGGRDIEAVAIPEADRLTLCVSSQAGCKMNCAFCMTGRGGWQGNLDASAIINQILSVPDSESLTNVVFMGMGEPLDNLDNVLHAIDILTSDWGLGWSPKRITVSTVGVNPKGLHRLLQETKVHIAFSLHNPFPAARAEIMPAERALSFHDVLQTLREFDFSHQRRLSIEYIMWRGVNDDMRHCTALARALAGLDCRVNLIRFHAFPGYDGQPSDKATMENFRDALNARNITATIRTSRGEDIEAACGQLSGEKKR